MIQPSEIYYIKQDEIELNATRFLLAAGVPVGYIQDGHLLIRDKHKYRAATRGGREWIAIPLKTIVDIVMSK